MIIVKIIGCLFLLSIMFLLLRLAFKNLNQQYEQEEKRRQYLKDNSPQDGQIRCPKCGSAQISANQKGFSAGKAIAGAVVAGGIGLAAGGIGSKNVIITCLKCGHQFKPGEQL